LFFRKDKHYFAKSVLLLKIFESEEMGRKHSHEKQRQRERKMRVFLAKRHFEMLRKKPHSGMGVALK